MACRACKWTDRGLEIERVRVVWFAYSTLAAGGAGLRGGRSLALALALALAAHSDADFQNPRHPSTPQFSHRRYPKEGLFSLLLLNPGRETLNRRHLASSRWPQGPLRSVARPQFAWHGPARGRGIRWHANGSISESAAAPFPQEPCL